MADQLLNFGSDLITNIDLFEYIDILLFDPVRFEKITDNVKCQHFFMLQRRLAIQYPQIVNSANITGIDQVAITNLYHIKLCNPNGRKPKWMFTKSSQIIGNGSSDNSVYFEEWQKQMICKVFSLERKTWESLLLRKPEWIESMVRMIERSHRSKLKRDELKDY